MSELRIETVSASLEAGRSAPGPALRFALTAAGIGLTLFGLFRLPWVQEQLLLPYARAQQQLAGALTGLEKLPVVVNFSCTGADVIALCLATVLAFPVPWRRRIQGALLGLVLISVVNTVRIGSLSLVVRERELFNTLHVVVWPAILIVVVSLYVFLWMRAARVAGQRDGAIAAPAAGRPLLLRFALWLVPLVTLYLATSAWYLESAWLAVATRWTALAGQALFALFGASATVVGSTLKSAHGAFVVTPICLTSPLVPVYYAAALSLPMKASRRAAWLLAGPLLFFVLGTLRLLVLALPEALVPSYLAAVHAFNQFVLGAILVVLAALWRRRSGTGPGSLALAARQSAAALALGLCAGALVGIPWTQLLVAVTKRSQSVAGHAGHTFADAQSATTLLPAYQLGLFVALVVAARAETGWPWRRLAAAASVLLTAQLALLVVAGELLAHFGSELDVRIVRGWSVVAPLLAAYWVSGRDLRSLWSARPGPQPVAEPA